MSAQEFLRRVEQTGMVSEPLLAELRKRVSETHRKMRPEMLAKLLVDRGELTAAQARKIVADAASGGPPPPPTEVPDEPEEEELQLATDDDEELGFAPEVDLGDNSGGSGFGLPDDLLADDLLADEPLPGAASPPVSPNSNNDLLDDGSNDFQLVEDDEQEYSLVEDDGELTLEAEDVVQEAILLDDDADAAPATPPAPPVEPVEPAVMADPEPDPILNDILADPVAVAPAGTATIRRKKSLAQVFQGLLPSGKGPKKRRWDSPLILIGGASLILLIAAGFLLFGLFYSESADEIFTAGTEAYESQSYGTAIKNFEQFSRQFSSHEKASLARVRIDMSRLRQLTDSSTPQWESALQTANSSLASMTQEEAFGEIRPELAKLLPDIAFGLVEQSKEATSTEDKQRVLNLAVEAMTLVNNPVYLPTSVRGAQELRISEIESNIEFVGRDIDRELALAQALEKISAATAANDIVEAYRLRDELINAYPLLEEDTQLAETLAAVTEKEKDAVVVGPSDLTPTTEDRPAAAKVSVVLSDQRGETAARANGIVGVLVRGAVYALDAASGQTRWRRFVGYETDVFPQAIANDGTNDLLLVSGSFGELQRVDAESGELRWRLPCPAPIRTPRIFGDRAFVTCGRDGESRLLAIELATGKVTAEVRVPVGCSVAPTVIDDRNELIQPGSHSSIYVLDLASLKCKRVFASRHTRGSLTVPATWAGNALVFAVNNGTSGSLLHAFTPVGDEDQWVAAGEPIATAGQVTTPPVVDDRRILVTSEMGEIRVFESPIDGIALREVALIPDSGAQLGATYAFMQRGEVWIANRTLAQYELQATRGRLVSRWARDRDDLFFHTLQRSGDVIVHVRQRKGLAGATVSAVSANSIDGTPSWETDIGVPSSIVVNSSGNVFAVTMNGAMFPINSKAVAAGITNERSSRVDARLMPSAFEQEIELASNDRIFASSPPLQHVVVANLTNGSLERIPLRIDGDRITSPLAAASDNAILAASASGPIYYLDGTTGQQRSGPFLPRTSPDAQLQWLRPATLSANSFVAAERSGAVYRITIANDRLVLDRDIQLTDATVIAGLASVGESVFMVVQRDGSEQLVSINGTTLETTGQTPIAGVEWGPRKVGQWVIVVDRERTMYAFDAGGELQWRIDNAPAPLSGPPLAIGDRLVLTSTAGEIATVDAKGQILSRQSFGEPFGSGPIAYKGRLLVGGWDGTLFVVNIPQ